MVGGGARRHSRPGTGRAVGGGGPNAPKPSSTRVGGTISRAARLVGVLGGGAWCRPAPTMRRSMSTNAPDSGRSDQRVSAVTWNSTIMPLPRLTAVTSGVPSASVAQVRSISPASGSASTWRVTVTSFGTGMLPNGPSRENAASGCGWSQLRLPPSMRPPRRSFTGTRSSSEPARRGPGEAHQHAAVLDPGGEPVARFARDVADVGQDDHRHVLLDEAAHRFGGRARLGQPHVGERIERAGEIEGRGEQRLRGVGGRAGDDADGAPAPALVEQLHGAGRTLGGNFQRGRCRCGFRPAG